MVAGAAQLAAAAGGHLFYPYLYDVLIAVAYGLMLPAIAVLHVRHRPVRHSGAILGTIAGTAAVAVGLGGSVNVDLRPAALFVLGIWWWTIGKMWAETRALPPTFGLVTAGLGLLAMAAMVVESASVLLALDAWTLARLALGGWLVALAIPLTGPAGSVNRLR